MTMRMFYGAGALCLVGCSVPLSSAGSTVHLSKSVPHLGCRELGVISGSGGGAGYTSSKMKMESAQNELRNETARLGGDLAVMDVVGSDVGGITITGRAYDCSAGPPQDPVPVRVVAEAEAPKATPESSGGESAPEAPSEPAPEAPDVETRLKTLDGLRDKGLISDEEYATRRAAILDSI